MPLQQVFEGSISGYDVKIILNAQGLIIFLWNPHRRRCYQARIPYLLQGKSLQIQTIFTNLDQFFLYLTQFSQDRERISINESGTLRVAYMLQKSKKLSPPLVYIPTEVLMTGAQIKNEVRLQREITDVKRQNVTLQNRINQLAKMNETNQAEIEGLRVLMARKQKRYDNSSDSEGSQPHGQKKKRRKKYSVISSDRSGIVQLNSAIKELSKQIEGMRGKIEQSEPRTRPRPMENVSPEQMQQIQKQTELAIFGEKMHITVDENNRYLKKQFKIQGNLITKIKGYGRYQLLSKQVIPPYGRHYFVMYIERITFKIFSLGIVSQRRRNYQNSHLSEDLISFFAKTGAIWENGDCRGGGPQIPNGVEIRIVVDMDKGTVKWFMDRREIASTVINKRLRGERLVAYLEINYQGDRVYWNQKDSVWQE